METRVVTVSAEAPEPERIAEAAAIIRNGGLVAFPTETVYGLGANALDANAVEKIFAAKGRPATNPLIVHTNGVEAAQSLVSDWPDAAAKLAAAFWPGPLTLVLPKADHVPEIVTAGGATVGVRVPSHPVARALIEAAGVPIAAPSANRSESVSPVLAKHVLAGMGGRIEMILDGGTTAGDPYLAGQPPQGLESTVLDVSASPPRLLRPGLVTPGEIEAIIGPIARKHKKGGKDAARSPGQMPRHYAPKARLEIVPSREIWKRAEALAQSGTKVGVIYYTSPSGEWRYHIMENLKLIWFWKRARQWESLLYERLHDMDQSGVDIILVQSLPHGDEWLAVRDRLTRAAVPKGDEPESLLE